MLPENEYLLVQSSKCPDLIKLLWNKDKKATLETSHCMLCRSWKSICSSSSGWTLEGFAGVWRWWSIVTHHQVILLPTRICVRVNGKIKAVPCGRWTPPRVRFVTSLFHCLHELDRQMQLSWWVCKDWELQNQSSAICCWFGSAFFHRIWPPARNK